MNINEIKEYLSGLSITEKQYIVGPLTPLISDILNDSNTIADITDSLQNLQFYISEIDTLSIINSYKKENHDLLSDSISISLPAAQELENFLIFFNASSATLERRKGLANYQNWGNVTYLNNQIVIRRLALSLSNIFEDKIYFWYSSGAINFKTYSNTVFTGDSMIQYDISQNHVQLWFDYQQLNELLGSNWQDNIKLLFDKLLNNIANYCSIQYAIIPNIALDFKIQSR